MGDDTLCSLRSIWRERASRWSAVRIGIAAPPPSVRPSTTVASNWGMEPPAAFDWICSALLCFSSLSSPQRSHRGRMRRAAGRRSQPYLRGTSSAANMACRAVLARWLRRVARRGTRGVARGYSIPLTSSNKQKSCVVASVETF
jgi:hypothetical protein